jgi:DNA excision repair protein ERCC-4
MALFQKLLEHHRDMEIIIDSREPKLISQQLIKLGVKVKTQSLNLGDYIIGPDHIVERKTGHDFIQSLYDKRLFDQTHRMLEEYENVILILEGLDVDSEIQKNIFGALAYLVIRRRITILPSTDKIETAHLIERMASWVQEEHDDPILMRGGPKRLTLKEKQEYFIQGLDGVGLKTADLLLDTLRSPNKIIEAINESSIVYTKTGNPKGITGKLAGIKGIGVKFVEKNKELLKKSN